MEYKPEQIQNRPTQSEPLGDRKQQQQQQIQKLELAKRKALVARKRAAGHILEAPIVVASSYDEILTASPGQRRSLSRKRQNLRREVGLEDNSTWMRQLRFGPGMIVNLTFAPLLLTMQATSAANSRVYCSHLVKAISDTLMPAITLRVFDQLSTQVVEDAKCRIQKVVSESTERMSNPSFVALVNRSVRDSFLHLEITRAMAEDYSEKMSKVSNSVDGLERYEGYIVRIEGDQVLLALEKDDNMKFVWEDAALLKPLGSDGEGDAIVVYEQRFSPGLTSRMVFGGAEEIAVTEEELAENERLIDERFLSLDDLTFPSY